ncbi:MAG TPA: hypothetical protein VFQ91_02855 [Bryobacteraceae bacterium]|nr:hypothetical protein [Bryobacteraceae bacterium]
MKLWFVLLICAAAWAEEGRLTFTKSFPGSTPAWLRIAVERNGQTLYQEAPDDPQPIALKLSASETTAIFGLAEKLGWFSRNLESGLPVAKMGDKTLRYEGGGKTQEQTFNYSTDPDAQAIADWFERICESERYLMELERSARFDKLGVNRIILQIQSGWERKRLVAVDQYLKWLDRIAKNESYLNMARERAARLAETFRNPQPAAAEAAKQ